MKLAQSICDIFLAFFFSYIFTKREIYSYSQCISCTLGTSVLTLLEKNADSFVFAFVLHALRAMRLAILRPLRFNTLVVSRLDVQPSLL